MKRQSDFISGLAMLTGAIVGAVLSSIFGKLFDKVDAKKSVFISVEITTVS
ncbi:hypothetical protein [Enterococcus sp. DIV0724b]|uniref:hypothetical protein n=1 Tax=Enterococcus sp. DIV0724b TaxID=2774694 RepID=UPI003D2FE1FE